MFISLLFWELQIIIIEYFLIYWVLGITISLTNNWKYINGITLLKFSLMHCESYCLACANWSFGISHH